jgi:hypothetical protein
VLRAAAAILAASVLGGFLGLATAQDKTSGWLDQECAKSCVANGYDAEFCSDVCWVPDPVKSAEADTIDWKCVTTCGARGTSARSCVATCRRH